MRRALVYFVILPVFFFLTPCLTNASDVSLERDLQKSLEQNKAVLDRVRKELRPGIVIVMDEPWR